MLLQDLWVVVTHSDTGAYRPDDLVFETEKDAQDECDRRNKVGVLGREDHLAMPLVDVIKQALDDEVFNATCD